MYLLDYIYMCRRISINDLFYIPRSERALNLLLKYTKWIRLERWVVCPFSKAVSYHQRPLCNPKYNSPKLQTPKIRSNNYDTPYMSYIQYFEQYLRFGYWRAGLTLLTYSMDILINYVPSMFRCSEQYSFTWIDVCGALFLPRLRPSLFVFRIET